MGNKIGKNDINNFKNLLISNLGKRFQELKKWDKVSDSMVQRNLGAIEGYRNALRCSGGIDNLQANTLRDKLISLETNNYTIRNLEMDIRWINNSKEAFKLEV